MLLVQSAYHRSRDLGPVPAAAVVYQAVVELRVLVELRVAVAQLLESLREPLGKVAAVVELQEVLERQVV